MSEVRFPSLKDGYYRYIRTKRGKVFWAFPDSSVFHIMLVEENKLTVFDILSAGFFEVRQGKVTLPEEVSIIDDKDKTNRSVGLRLEPWTLSDRSIPDDLTLILQILEKGNPVKTPILLDPEVSRHAGVTRYICLKCKKYSGDALACKPCPVEGSPNFDQACLDQYGVEVPGDYREQCEKSFASNSPLPPEYPVYRAEKQEPECQTEDEEELPF